MFCQFNKDTFNSVIGIFILAWIDILIVNKDIYNKDVCNWVILIMISLIELEMSDSIRDIYFYYTYL